jgi:peptide/nickel transport system substrate-binding protein
MLRAADGEDNRNCRVRRSRRRSHRRRSTMRTPLRPRAARLLVALGLALSAVLPAASTVGAQEDELVLQVGTDQVSSGLNPWQATYVLDYEVFTLNYDLLVGYDENLGFTEGFATSWETSDDGLTTTFKIRPGMLWSDGEPATAEDARWTYQLVLDAMDQEVVMGSGYLDGYLSSAGLTAVTAPDAETLVVETETPTSLLLPAYVPILPKHIWSQYTLEQIADSSVEGYFANDPPVVGTGPYVATEYKPNESMTFTRNENYWGKQGAADRIVITTFSSNDTMVQALRNGEIDYARGVSADAFDSLEGVENIERAEGFANGYSYLTFNGYEQPIEGGGSSTTATKDPAFRDALGWAIDYDLLVDRVLAGHGTPGTSLLPPFQAQWYVAPDPSVQRSFNLETANEKLVAAGYVLDGSGRRLDKEGQPITLRLTWPGSEDEDFAAVAQFIVEWWGDLGITVEPGVVDDDTLLEDILSPENDGLADFDTYMWGWVGDVDPTSLLEPFTTDAIAGGSSDTFWSNARFDELFVEQGRELDIDARKAMLQEMQELFYAELPNIPLYYDSELHAYRTDKFGGWQNQPPDSGTPLFGFGPIGYTLLTDASATPSEPPAASGGTGASAGPTSTGGTPGSPTSTSSDNTPLLLGGLGLLIAAIVVGGFLWTRRGAAAEEE